MFSAQLNQGNVAIDLLCLRKVVFFLYILLFERKNVITFSSGTSPFWRNCKSLRNEMSSIGLLTFSWIEKHCLQSRNYFPNNGHTFGHLIFSAFLSLKKYRNLSFCYGVTAVFLNRVFQCDLSFIAHFAGYVFCFLLFAFSITFFRITYAKK